jgi:hypothetical protein
MQQYSCFVRVQQSLPCNTVAVGAFFVFMIALDPIRGLVLLAFLCSLPHAIRKHDNSHSMCATVYFVCACVGIAQFLSFVLDSEHNPKRWPAPVQVIFVFALAVCCAVLVWLVIDIRNAPPAKSDSASAQKYVTQTKIVLKQGSNKDADVIGRAPEMDDHTVVL